MLTSPLPELVILYSAAAVSTLASNLPFTHYRLEFTAVLGRSLRLHPSSMFCRVLLLLGVGCLLVPTGVLAANSSQPQFVPACGGVIDVKDNGTIQSPLFPQSYPPHIVCIWELKAPDGYQIKLKFEYFKLGLSPVSSMLIQRSLKAFCLWTPFTNSFSKY